MRKHDYKITIEYGKFIKKGNILTYKIYHKVGNRHIRGYRTKCNNHRKPFIKLEKQNAHANQRVTSLCHFHTSNIKVIK